MKKTNGGSTFSESFCIHAAVTIVSRLPFIERISPLIRFISRCQTLSNIRDFRFDFDYSR